MREKWFDLQFFAVKEVDQNGSESEESLDDTQQGDGTEAGETLLTGSEQKPDEKLDDGADDAEQSEDEKDETEEIKYGEWDLPEGMELDTAMSEQFVALAKDMKLTQEQAQGLVNLYADRVGSMVEAQSKLVAGWRAESEQLLGADKEKEMAVAVGAIDRFGSPEFRKFLNESGIGNHPEMVKFCLAVGKQIGEDGFIEGNRGEAQEKSLGDLLYDNDNSGRRRQ